MFNALIPQHLSAIQDLLSSQTLLVYRGFPNHFLQEMMKHISPLTPATSLLNADGKIKLQELLKEAKSLAKAVAQLSEQAYMMSFEEFMLISQEIEDLSVLNRQFVIFTNNLQQEYPNSCDISFEDIEKKVELGLAFEDDPNFQLFFVNSRILKGVNYVQYRTVDHTSDSALIESRNFFSVSDYELPAIKEIEESSLTANYISYPSADASYQQFLYDIYTDQIRDETKLVVGSEVFDKENASQTEQLKMLAHIFQQANKPLTFYRLSQDQILEYRPEIDQILSTYWESEGFRSLTFYTQPEKDKSKHTLSQGQIIERVLQEVEKAHETGTYSDIFLTAPTGAGKSILFQIPAIYLAQQKKCVSIVISPLKALMYDQVEALHQRGVMEAAYINSDLALIERAEILEQVKVGAVSILYLSPELLLAYDINYFLRDRKLGLLVVDEAHLVTTWGRDFRVDYWFLGVYLRKLRKYTDQIFPILALTATAVYGGKHDTVFETIDSLNMQRPHKYLGDIRRDDIEFKLEGFEYEEKHDASKIAQTAQVVEALVAENKKAIVYFPWTKQIRETSASLSSEARRRTAAYYGTMGAEERASVAQQFKNGDLQVVLATKAFGMGIDISDITHVYHHAPSGSLSDYVQEIGRVARDEKIEGLAATDFHANDLKYSRILFGLSSIKQWQVHGVLRKMSQISQFKKAHNFLASVEDFGFIFGERDDLEQKVKSAFLLLEKDLLQRFGYSLVIVRPESLFTKVYARVDQSKEAEFTQIYGEHLNLLAPQHEAKTGLNRVQQMNHKVYEIDLYSIWEKHFKEVSFPQAKRSFFSKRLFSEMGGKVYPQMNLKINLFGAKKDIFPVFKKYFNALDKSLANFQQTLFSLQDLEKLLVEHLEDAEIAKKMATMTKALYSSYRQMSRRGIMEDKDSFLQIRKSANQEEEQLRLAAKGYLQVRTNLESKFKQFFPTDDSQHFEKFITTDAAKNRRSMKMAYILETFKLGTYEIEGGKLPQVFIRINDTDQVKALAEDENYQNGIVTEINQQHKTSEAMMEHFFSTKMDQSTRWDYIEDYFLGKVVNDE